MLASSHVARQTGNERIRLEYVTPHDKEATGLNSESTLYPNLNISIEMQVALHITHVKY